MDEAPTSYKALDYGLRWGIGARFSDFRTRGFGLEDAPIRHPDRLERLILVMALARCWAVSTGMCIAAKNPSPAEKNRPLRSRKGSRAA